MFTWCTKSCNHQNVSCSTIVVTQEGVRLKCILSHKCEILKDVTFGQVLEWDWLRFYFHCSCNEIRLGIVIEFIIFFIELKAHINIQLHADIIYVQILCLRNFYHAIWISPVSDLSEWGDLFSDLFCANFAKYLLNICGQESDPLSASRRCHSSLPTKFRSGGQTCGGTAVDQ